MWASSLRAATAAVVNFASWNKLVAFCFVFLIGLTIAKQVELDEQSKESTALRAKLQSSTEKVDKLSVARALLDQEYVAKTRQFEEDSDRKLIVDNYHLKTFVRGLEKHLTARKGRLIAENERLKQRVCELERDQATQKGKLIAEQERLQKLIEHEKATQASSVCLLTSKNVRLQQQLDAKTLELDALTEDSLKNELNRLCLEITSTTNVTKRPPPLPLDEQLKNIIAKDNLLSAPLTAHYHEQLRMKDEELAAVEKKYKDEIELLRSRAVNTPIPASTATEPVIPSEVPSEVVDTVTTIEPTNTPEVPEVEDNTTSTVPADLNTAPPDADMDMELQSHSSVQVENQNLRQRKIAPLRRRRIGNHGHQAINPAMSTTGSINTPEVPEVEDNTTSTILRELDIVSQDAAMDMEPQSYPAVSEAEDSTISSLLAETSSFPAEPDRVPWTQDFTFEFEQESLAAWPQPMDTDLDTTEHTIPPATSEAEPSAIPSFQTDLVDVPWDPDWFEAEFGHMSFPDLPEYTDPTLNMEGLMASPYPALVIDPTLMDPATPRYGDPAPDIAGSMAPPYPQQVPDPTSMDPTMPQDDITVVDTERSMATPYAPEVTDPILMDPTTTQYDDPTVTTERAMALPYPHQVNDTHSMDPAWTDPKFMDSNLADNTFTERAFADPISMDSASYDTEPTLSPDVAGQGESSITPAHTMSDPVLPQYNDPAPNTGGSVASPSSNQVTDPTSVIVTLNIYDDPAEEPKSYAAMQAENPDLPQRRIAPIKRRRMKASTNIPVTQDPGEYDLEKELYDTLVAQNAAENVAENAADKAEDASQKVQWRW